MTQKTEHKENIVKGKIANAITSAAKNHIVATTDDLYDTNLSEYQDEINQSIFETLSDVAKEDTLVTGISNIREDISKKELDTTNLAKEDTLVEGVAHIVNKIETTQPDLSAVAKESTLTQGVQDIREDISHIQIDTSDLAKQGTNTGATNTTIYERLGNMVLMTEDEYTPAINDLLSRLN